MLSFRSASSSQSSTGSKSSTEKQEQLGLWLSLSSHPRNYHCSHCRRSFCSLKDVTDHQNAHREALQPPTKMASNTATVAVTNNPNQTDTVLRLGCGPPNKVTPFYEFMPIMKGRKRCLVDDAPSGSGVNKTYAEIRSYPSPTAFGEIAQVPLSDGAYARGFGDGADSFLEASAGGELALLADPYGALMLI